jgi:DNA-binding transcriptional regulator YhcF (GntR family)
MNELPVFEQIVLMLENGILENKYKSDEQIISTNKIAAVMGVNHITAAKALNKLFTQKIIYKKRGVGMFVSKNASKIITQKRKNIFLKKTLPQIKAEAKLLNIPLNKFL